MINYEQEVKKIHPNAAIQKVGYYDWHKNRYKDENPKFIVTGYFVNIPTVWMPQAKYPEQAWKSAYEKLNQPKNMTPLQKSIAEIEAEIAENEKQVEYYEEEGLKNYVLFKQSIINGLNRAISIITANLEYERDVIKKAYKAGIENEYGYCQRLIEQQSEQPCTRQCEHCKTYYAPLEEQLISDYYTKTYNNERKD